MYRACIAVVDASRARLFTFRRAAEAEGIHEELSEQQDLVNLARRQRPSELFSDTPGSNRTGGLRYAFDDHRDAHLDELDVEFARYVTTELGALLRTTAPQRLIVCASPRMLGHLREVGGELRRDRSLAIDEVPRDLVKLTTFELRDRLASYGLLPPQPSRPVLLHEPGQ